MAITPILPVFPVPVLPQTFDTSLSYYELLAKLTETINQCVTIVNALSVSVSAIEQAIGDLPQLSDDVAQLQIDLAAEVQARADGYDTLYNQINQVRTLVINEYVDNETFDAALGGGIRFMLITKAVYDELDPPDPNIIYYVQDGDTLTPYYRGGVVNASTGMFSRAARSITAEPVNFNSSEV